MMMVAGLQKSGEKNLMAPTWTEAAKVRRVFKAGRQRQKDRLLTPTAAIYETCILLDKLREAMHDAKLDPDDVRAYLVVGAEPKLGAELVSGKVIVIPPPKRLPEVFRKVEAIRESRMLGIVFHQADRDPKAKAPFSVWVHPFIIGTLAERVLLEARNRVAQGKALDN
ncbi:MAG: hypothetical protein ABSG40_13805 [Terriglobales bacterium]|jgi:hypothetical protein